MFAYISGQDVVRQHCAFVVSKYADRLCSALAFRNMHLDSIVWIRALEKSQSEQKFTLGYPLSYVRWSASKEAAEAAECLQVLLSTACFLLIFCRLPAAGHLLHALRAITEHPTVNATLQTVSDGRISLKSEDETARLVLHPHGRRFAVCFPLLIGKTQDENNALTYHYVWQTQVFATADFPERWEYPLKLALSVVQTSSGQEAAQTVEEGGKQEKDKSAAGACLRLASIHLSSAEHNVHCREAAIIILSTPALGHCMSSAAANCR